METRFGFPLDVWEAIKGEARHILIECAANRETITYGELSRRITTAAVPHYGFKMVGLLSELGDTPAAAGKAPLATLVVRKSDGLPGDGYFDAMLPDGASLVDKAHFWQAEFERTCRDWGGDDSTAP